MAFTFTEPYLEEYASTHRGVYTFDGTTYTLMSDSTSADYFTDTAVAGDALIFRTGYSQLPVARIKVNVGTAMAGTDIVLKWYIGGKTSKVNDGGYEYIEWIEVTSDITDNTNGFTTIGENTIEFPVSVVDKKVLGKFAPITTNARDAWVKCEIDSATTITEGGANQTSKISYGSNLITVTGSHLESTITSNMTSYRISDTSYPITNDANCRAVWFPAQPETWNKSPIRNVSGTGTIDLGLPYAYSPSGVANYMDTDDMPQAGDTYVVGHTFEDVRLACVADGKDWIVGLGWQPRSQDYKHYQFNCSLTIDNISTTTGYTFLADFSKRVSFYGNYKLYCDIATADRGKMMLGARMWGYNSKDAKKGPSDNLPIYGCNIDYITNGVNGINSYLVGEFAGCTFESGCKYSFVTYFYIYKSQIYSCIMGNCQIGNGLDCTGQTLIHSPVAEPFRDPNPTFTLKDFRAGGPVIYMVSSAGTQLDGPSSNDALPFRTYAGFVNDKYCNIIDKEENTRKAVSWGAFVDPTGTFYFKYRIKAFIKDEDGNAIVGANVSIVDNTSAEQISEVSDADGYIGADDNTIVTESTLRHTTAGGSTASDEVLFGPFVITITKAGYETLIVNMEIQKKEDLTLAMKKAIPVMIGANSTAVKIDPRNSGVNRDKIA